MIDDEYMVPNEKFMEFYNDEIINEVEPPAFSDTLKIGTFILIRKVISDLQLNELFS